MSKIVIGLSGYKGSGKDMVADYLVESGWKFERLSFADPLKEMCAVEYNIPINFFYDRDKKETPLLHLPVRITDNFIAGIVDLLKDEFRTKNGSKPVLIRNDGQGLLNNGQYEDIFYTPRALAIFKGSGNRAVDGDFWIKKAIDHINNNDSCDYFIIPDLRFQTEAATLKERFGENFISVRVDRFPTVDSNDPSERDLDSYHFDYYINNKKSENVTKDKVFEQVNQIINLKEGVCAT